MSREGIPFDRNNFLNNICNSQSSSFLVADDYKESSVKSDISQCRNRDYNSFGDTRRIKL